MKKLCFGLALLFCASLVIAAESSSNQAKAAASDTDKMEQAKRILYKHTGGMLRKAGSGRGRIVVVDAQSKVPASALMVTPAFVEKRLRLFSAYRKATLEGMPSRETVKKVDAEFAIFIVDNPKLEDSLLVSPESRWALVNVSALGGQSVSADVLSKRTTTQVARAMGFLCGSANSQYRGTIMGPMRGPESLDVFNGNGEIPIDQFQRVVEYAKGLGMEQFVEATYRRACEQGWAPDPKDEYQKAIWDKVHELPTQPLTIEPEKAPTKK